MLSNPLYYGMQMENPQDFEKNSMEQIIRRKLAESLHPSVLEVCNDSHLHAGHAGDDGSGQTHFRVKVASKAFAGLSRIEAQRLVYKALDSEMKGGIHALVISVVSE